MVELFDYEEIEREVAGELDTSYRDITPIQAADFLNTVRKASRDAVTPAEVQTHIRKMIQEVITSG